MHTHFTTQLKLSLVTSKGTYFFHSDDIVRLEASSNYTNIYFTHKTSVLSAKVLKEFSTMLEPFGFLRTHRTHLVNRHHISHVDMHNNIVMNDASVAEISKRKKSIVMKALLGATLNG